MLTPSKSRLLGKLAVETELGSFLQDTRIRLLEAIDQHGSISQAAKMIPLSYKAAWDAVDAMNNLADQPLVERAAGGRHGGGTHLTDYGRRLISLYRTMEQEYQEVLDRLSHKLGETGDTSSVHGLLRRMAMKTSARNQFVGPVSALRDGGVNIQVSLQLDDATEITAIITKESAENLRLAIGREVHAFFKAQSVLLITDKATRVSARNKLWGIVSRIHDGAANSEVTLTLLGGRTVTATITRESALKLGILPGISACAVFDASSVILAVSD